LYFHITLTNLARYQ